MNWNSRDRFSASIDEHYYNNNSSTTTSTTTACAASTPPSQELEDPCDAPQLPPFEIFDPFSTIDEWTEAAPLEPKTKSSAEPTTAAERMEGDLENCESLFVENSGAESGSFFDPLQTIMDDEEESKEKDDGVETDAESHSEATNVLSNNEAADLLGRTGDAKPSPDTMNRTNPGQVEEFVFVDDSDVPPSPPPSPSNNELNLESYCLVSVPGDSDLEKSSKEQSFSDDHECAQTNPFEIVQASNLVQKGEGEIHSENCQDQERHMDSDSKTSSAGSVTSSAPSSSLLHSPSPANSSMDSSVSCEDASSSNSTSLASYDGCDDQTFGGLLVKDKQFSGDDTLDNSAVDWLSSTVTIQKPFQLATGPKTVGESQKVKKDDSNSNGQIQSKIHPSPGSTPALLHIDTENSKHSELKLTPGLHMSEGTVILKDLNGRKKRAFSLVIYKSNYTEKVYLKATNLIKNEQTCFSQASPVSRFGTIMSSFTFGLKKLENIFPRLSLETYNVLNFEKLLEMSSEDYETLRRLRRSAEDAIFLARSDSHAHDKQGASKAHKTAESMKSSEKEYFDDSEIRKSCQNSEASLKNSVITARESIKSFRSARLLRTLSQRLSQHFLSREETVETDHEMQKIFRKEEVFLDFVDEFFLDISFCNDRSATNLKLCTKLFVTLFLNKPFRLTIALNDRRYELQSGVENIIKEKSNSLSAVQGQDNQGKLITIKDANTCGQAMSDYSGNRELILDDSNIGRKFEAMRIKVFSGAELEVNTLPLSLSAQAKTSHSGQIQLKMTLSCRRRCQNILLRFSLPEEWLQAFEDTSLLEARNVNRRIATVGFNRLQTLLTYRGNVDSNLFEVSCGEAWFHEATGELIWRIEELSDVKDVNRSNFLLLRLNLIVCNNQSPKSDWLGKSEAPPRDFELTNRFVKIAFNVEDCNVSNVEPALVRIDRSHWVKGQRSEDQKYPEVTTSHATRFEYCVEIDVLKESQG